MYRLTNANLVAFSTVSYMSLTYRKVIVNQTCEHIEGMNMPTFYAFVFLKQPQSDPA